MEKKILWTNNVWTITDIGKENSVMIDNHNSTKLNWHVDYAIVYDNGEIAYKNNPFVIPQYVKRKVTLILKNKLKKVLT